MEGKPVQDFISNWCKSHILGDCPVFQMSLLSYSSFNYKESDRIGNLTVSSVMPERDDSVVWPGPVPSFLPAPPVGTVPRLGALARSHT